MIDIQYGITIMGGRDVSRPYRVWFFAEGELFFMFLFLCPQYLSTKSGVGAKKLVAVSQLPLTLNLKNLIL
ncbi:MAG: hypothetical protein MR602_02130 [Bacteroidales bacterium]|nr:hypothetical protein [Bacteroidales bacterium]